MPDESVLLEAHRIVNGDRDTDYGDSNSNLTNIATIASAIGQPIDAVGVAKVMIAVKLAREGYRHKRDNLVDLCGYAELLDRLYPAKQPSVPWVVTSKDVKEALHQGDIQNG